MKAAAEEMERMAEIEAVFQSKNLITKAIQAMGM